MTVHPFARVAPIQVMADGTTKQINPFSGTEVWTVPGRGDRPMSSGGEKDARPLQAEDFTHKCVFCSQRAQEVPPEKARMLDDGTIAYQQPLGGEYQFRRVANMFEILPFCYWKANYDVEMDPRTREWMKRYVATPGGKQHVEKVVQNKWEMSSADEESFEEAAEAFFASGHDLIIARRHFVDGATDDSELASAGTLTVAEHRDLTRFTADSIRELYAHNSYATYVAAFQNWLKPAGASMDHLHKQIVAIDARSRVLDDEVRILRDNPNMYNEWGVDYAMQNNLLIAENDHAVMFAGFGHRFPTIEIYSKSATCLPWEQSPEEVAGMSDLMHAAHAAVGPEVPSNEEWHHQPADVEVAMPWRIMLKLRISTLAGFEGGTHIYINTLTPWQLRDKIVDKLYQLRDEDRIADFRIATECTTERNKLKYAQ